jgi:hypothetical protein
MLTDLALAMYAALRLAIMKAKTKAISTATYSIILNTKIDKDAYTH